jgi:ABC-type multidrug transport system ATPase subunit
LTDPANAKRQLGYASAPEHLPPLLTARQCFEVHAGAKGLPTVDADLMILAEELKFLPYLEAFVDTLSLGTKQKLAVLLCLVGDPKLIILDEAFNGLDPASSLVLKHHLRWRLKERGAALVPATHALDIVEHYADHAALLLDGVLTREWSKSEIDELRMSGRGFDTALADTRRDLCDLPIRLDASPLHSFHVAASIVALSCRSRPAGGGRECSLAVDGRTIVALRRGRVAGAGHRRPLACRDPIRDIAA